MNAEIVMQNIFVYILQYAYDEQGFLGAWDVSTETEDDDKLAVIAKESVELVKTLYNTTI